MPDPINWSIAAPYLLTALAFGYLLGSIPFGLIFTRFAGMGDVRTIGSGNIGATNVLRTGNKQIAFATLLGDVLKGTAAVLIAKQWGPDTALCAGFGAFLGHCFPVWLGFKGGKGVATYMGILAGFSLTGMVIFAICWLSTAYVSRYSSLAALSASIIVPIALFFLGYRQWAELFAILSLLLIFRHRQNITRLMRREETKIGQKG